MEAKIISAAARLLANASPVRAHDIAMYRSALATRPVTEKFWDDVAGALRSGEIIRAEAAPKAKKTATERASAVLTANELEALKGIDSSEYGDSLTSGVWSWSVTDNCALSRRSIAGVIASLQAKGFVKVSDSGTKDAAIWMTAEGAAAYLAVVGKSKKFHEESAS